MVYITDFSEFQQRALDLVHRDPNKTRYLTKYRQKDNEAVIKVTNDTECWQFRIDQSNLDSVNDFIRDITAAFIKAAANRQVDDAAIEQASSQPGGKKKGKKGGK